VAFGPANIPRLNEVTVDWRTLAAAAAAALTGGLVATLAPLWRVRQQGAANVQRSAGRGVARGRLQGGLIVTQLALSVALLGAAGVFVRSFWNTLTADLGIVRSGVAIAEVQTRSGTQSGVAFPEAIRRLEALPGVAAAGAVQDFFIVRNPQARLLRDGKAEVQGALTADLVSPGYFRAVGTRLLKGRYLAESDYVPGGRNVVIDETVAKRYWPGEDPVGQSFRRNEGSPPATVVGIITAVRRQGIDRDPPGQLFYPGYPGRMTIAVRLRQAAPGALRSIQEEIRGQGLILPREPRMIESALSEQTTSRRFYGLVMGGFAALAVLLAALGVYGVVQYSVLQRRRELGIRMAVGATAQDVLRLVLSQGLRYGVIGVAAGLAGFLALAGVLDSLLFGVSATDPLSIASAGGILLLATLLACWMPARHAVSIQPLEALRSE
jgi:predicted permease